MIKGSIILLTINHSSISPDRSHLISPFNQETTRLTNRMEPIPPLPSDWTLCQAYLASRQHYCRQFPKEGLSYCGNHLDYKNNPESIPPLPSDWNRCYAYVPRKKRYCRQVPGKGLLYCGNHLDYVSTCQPTDANTGKEDAIDGVNVIKRPRLHVNSFTPPEEINRKKGKRIPCPVDGSHTIYESNLKSHIKKCNLSKQRANDRAQVYYKHEINRGGFGSLHSLKNDIKYESGEKSAQIEEVKDAKYYQNIAISILRAYELVFGPGSGDENNNTTNNNIDTNKILNMTQETMYGYIPCHNYFMSEIESGLEDGLAEHRIKIGGPKHLEQIGSIVGHVRNMVASDDDIKSESKLNSPDAKKNVDIILEIGAGRATTGFVVASVLAHRNIARKQHDDLNGKPIANETANGNHVKLILVERAGSRGKADRAFRREERFRNSQKQDVQEPDQNPDALDSSKLENDDDKNIPESKPFSSYMHVNGVHVERIKCDLAHVHLPTVLSMEEKCEENPIRRDIIVVAKHCCGVGTDLALKSLIPIRDRIHGCIFTTCCHGACSWNDYVGRDYLHNKMMAANEIEFEGFQFNEDAFNMMKRWAAGTSIGTAGLKMASENQNVHHSDLKEDNEHSIETHENSDKLKSITFIVQALNLACGVLGLGRACQRLIDYGRHRYIEDHIFPSLKRQKEECLLHYVDSSVTPQNFLLKHQYS